MAYIEVKNLNFNNNLVNLTINDKEVIGIFGENQRAINEFLLIISGINKNNNTCFYNGENIFDNSHYFKQRIFLDFKKIYTNTLNKEFIEENFNNRFGLSFDTKRFKELIKELKIRKETEIDVYYTFTQQGNTLVNFSLIESLNVSNIIISHPTNYLDSERATFISNALTNKNKYNCVILNLDRLDFFKNKLDYLLLFTKEGNIIKVNNDDHLLVIEDNIYLHNRLIRGKGNLVISYHDYNKDELKKFDKLKIKYKVISLYDIDKYREVEL